MPKIMDELDRKIIELMKDDARLSFRKIARETGKSTDTIINHFATLKETGKIRGTTIIVDIEKLNYQGMAAFQIDAVKTEHSEPSSIMQTLIKMPNIIVATKTVGEHDLLVLAVIHDIKHYTELGKEIAEIPGVKDIASSLWVGNKEICPQYFIV